MKTKSLIGRMVINANTIEVGTVVGEVESYLFRGDYLILVAFKNKNLGSIWENQKNYVVLGD